MTTTTAMKKMTKKDYYNAILAIPDVTKDEELVKFINHELELLDKKKTGTKKPTATQTANEGIKEAILYILAEVDRAVTIAEIQTANTDLEALSNQKMSALLKQLCDAGQVEKIVDKRKTYFKAIA